METKVYVVDTPQTDRSNSFYASNGPPLLSSPLVKLPLGSVQAEGWMRHQLELMAEGLTGHLPELSTFLKSDSGWFGTEREGWEDEPYWLRGFHDLGVLLNNKRILTEAKRWIETVIASQDEDGYFGAKFNKCVVGKNGQKLADLWPHMVMLDVLITHYEHSGDERIIPLMTHFFRWCATLPDDQFLRPKKGFGNHHLSVQWVRAGDMLPHLYWLYNRKKEAWLLDLATRFHQKVKPPEGEWLDHHVVNFTQRFREPGTYYTQSHNPAHIMETERWYKQHMSTWGQQPGGIFAADERIRPGKTDPKQACETCAMIEFNKSFYILGKITGKALYADRCEDIQFNSFPVTQSPDFKALHYLTAANQPQLDSSANHDYYNKGRMIDYSPYRYRCCMNNISMGWPYYTEHLWMATADNGFATWLYGPSRVSAQVGHGMKVSVHEKTEYPFDETVQMIVRTKQRVHFPLYLRVPMWCKNFQVRVNGVPLSIYPRPGQYVVIERTWANNDVVKLKMPMEVTLTEWKKSANSVTVNRGPLSYSLKIGEDWRRSYVDQNKWSQELKEWLGIKEDRPVHVDNDKWPEWEIFPSTPWNYGLIVDRTQPEKSLEVIKKKDVSNQPWTLEAAPIEIHAKGRRIPNWTLVDETVTALPSSPVKSDEPVENITLIPMGCARLRISCFPTIGVGSDSHE